MTIELEQYKAWIVTLHARYQEVVAERDALKAELGETQAARDAYLKRGDEAQGKLVELREAAEAAYVALDAAPGIYVTRIAKQLRGALDKVEP